MIATDLIGAIVETEDCDRFPIRAVSAWESAKGPRLLLWVEDDDGFIACHDSRNVKIVRPVVAITPRTITAEHIEAVRTAGVVAAAVAEDAHHDLLKDDRSGSTPIADVVSAYNRLAGGGGK